jgi:rfaE bifunctional protein kinase chain/domain/rfaE bifunctional protein nucleotidyltransferase chain/domain
VLILRADAHEMRLGGAASVALLLRGLEARVTLAGVVGDDSSGGELRQIVVDAGIDGSAIHADPHRPTTTKERFVGRAADRHPHQMLRVDTETREPISRAMEKVLAASLTEHMSEFDAVLISDYAKGTCTTALLAILIDAARAAQVPVLVDPARVDDYGRYRRATLVKPNRTEAELASGFRIVAPQDALVAGGRLCRQHGFESTLITLDQEGMALVQDDESQELFRTLPRKVCDITGAGDMALAALGVCLASRLALPDSICIANVAAGLEVEKFGVAPVSRAELQQALVQLPLPLGEGRSEGEREDTCIATDRGSFPPFVRGGQGGSFQATEDFKLQNEKCKLQIDDCRPGVSTAGSAGSSGIHPAGPTCRSVPAGRLALIPNSEIQNPNSPSKLITASQAASLAQAARAQGRSIVFTNGCFDLLHVGHVTCLYEAAELGDLLIVALNSDASVGRLKGPGRPVIDERSRAAMLSALECVDNIVIFAEDTPIDLIRAIRPDVLVKGGTYRPEEIAGRDIVEAGGGRVQVVRHLPGVSTSAIVSAIAGSVGECFTQAHDDPRPPP